VQDRDELAALIDGQLKEALHRASSPSTCVIVRGYCRRSGRVRPTRAVLEVPQALLRQFESDPRPSGAPPRSGPFRCGEWLTRSASSRCSVDDVSCGIAPAGATALGRTLFERDKALLASMAGHAGGALENLMLAEQMAERIEAERRAAQEVQIAAEVQRRLLPVKTTTMATVESSAGACRRDRSAATTTTSSTWVEGGSASCWPTCRQGLYAALLMAHLQASVRSLAAAWRPRTSSTCWARSIARLPSRRRAITSRRCSSALRRRPATAAVRQLRSPAAVPAESLRRRRAPSGDGGSRRVLRRLGVRDRGGGDCPWRPAGAVQ